MSRSLYLSAILFFLLSSDGMAQVHPDAVYPIPFNCGSQLYNSINLFTGNVNRVVKLGNITGRSLNYSVDAFYNSQSAQINYSNPQRFYNNVLGGYGWKLMDYPKLVSDSGNYYLLDGYAAYKLILENSSGNNYNYDAGYKYHLWKIMRTGNGTTQDRWQIITESGLRYLFNIPAIRAAAMQWNLTAMAGAQWADSLYFNYGTSNNLQRITNLLGDTLQFSYQLNGNNFYLSGITSLNGGRTSAKTTISYKPYLFNGTTYNITASIKYDNAAATAASESGPADLSFKYIINPGPMINTGALDSIKESSGSVTTFKYEQADIHDRMITYPAVQSAINNGYDNNSGDTVDANTYTCFMYHYDNATWDSTGVYAQYNLTEVYPGGRHNTNHQRQHPFGSKEYYFFNGLPASGLLDLPAGYNTAIVTLPFVKGEAYQMKVNSDSLVHNPELEQAYDINYWEIGTSLKQIKVRVTRPAKKQALTKMTDPNASYARIQRMEKMLYGVIKRMAYKYDPSTGLAVGVYSSVNNPALRSNGQQSDSIIQLTTYAYQAYPALGADSLHILSIPARTITVIRGAGSSTFDTVSCNVMQWTKWNQSGNPKASQGTWDEWRYYTMSDPAANTNDAFNSIPNPSQWLKENEILQRTPTGSINGFRGIDSIAHYSTYSKNSFGNYAVASFVNASPSSQEASFIGFEDYENYSTWNPSGILTGNNAHTGLKSFQPNQAVGAWNLFLPVSQSVKYLVSFWYRTGITTGFFAYQYFDRNNTPYERFEFSLGNTNGQWRYFEQVIDLPVIRVKHNNIPLQAGLYFFTRSANNDFLIDDIRFCVAVSPFSASVYDPVKKIQTASIANNGATLFTVFNADGQPISSVGPDSTRQVRTLSVVYNSANGSGMFSDTTRFDPDQPNMMIQATARNGGIWEKFLFRNDYFPPSTLVNMVIEKGRLKSNGTNSAPASAKLSPSITTDKDFLLYTEIAQDNFSYNQEAGLSLVESKQGNTNELRFVLTNNAFKLYNFSSGIVYDSIHIRRFPARSSLLLEIVDSSHLFAYVDGRFLFDYRSTGKFSNPFKLVSTCPNSYFANFILLNSPVISKSTYDGTYNFRQSLARKDAVELQVQEKLYGGALDLHGATTRSTYVSTTNTRRTLKTGPVDGMGLNYIKDFANYDAATQTVDSASIVAGQFGYNNPYSFSQQYDNTPLLTVRASGSGGTFSADSNATTYNYGSDSNSIIGFRPNSLLITKTTTPDQLQEMHVVNNDGSYFASVQNGNGDTIVQQYAYDKSMRLKKQYQPNFFQDSVKNSKLFSQSNYSFTNNKTSYQTPDAGRKQYVYDQSGRICFVVDSAGLRVLPNRVMYQKYDLFSRLSEIGYCLRSWNAALFQQYANTHTYPGPLVWTKRYVYDGNGRSPNIGYVTQIAVNNNADTIADVVEGMAYDIYGNVAERSVKVSSYDTSVYKIKYKYDLLGNISSVDYGSGKIITYSYNSLGKITGIGTPSNPVYYAGYEYSDTLFTETLNNTKLKRVYDLNPAGWIDNITDTLFHEALTYTNGGLDGTGYYSGLIASATTTYTWPNAPPAYTYKYKYDVFGRLIAGYVVETMVNDLNYAVYDENNNISILQRWQDKTVFWSNSTSSRQNLLTTRITRLDTAKVINNSNIKIYGLDIDPASGKIYWANDRLQFQRSDFNGSNLETLPLMIGVYPQGIALDTKYRQMYIAVPTLRNIVKADINGKNQANIISGVCPQNISVFPSLGKIFWPDGNAGMGTPAITIKSANLDGTGVTTLVTFAANSQPITGFELDTMRKKMYWALGGMIQYANLDGTGITTLYVGGGFIRQLALDIFNKQVFWADQTLGKIQQINFDRSGYSDVITGINKPEWVLQNLMSNIYTYDKNSNHLSGTSGNSGQFIYDKNGNIIKSAAAGIDTIQYGFTTQLPLRVSKKGRNINLQYGAVDQRVLKNYGDTSLLYIHGSSPYPVVERMKTTGQPESVISYVYGPAGLVSFNYNNTDYFVLRDHLGSVRVIINSNNQAIANLDYSPFGELMTDISNTGGSLAPPIDYRYTGQEYDAQTGLYNYRSRMYDPVTARFYSPDPLGREPSPYSYVGNNPVSRNDPTGMFWAELFSGAVTGAILGANSGAIVIPFIGAVPGVVVGAVVGAFVGGIVGLYNDASNSISSGPTIITGTKKIGATGTSYKTKSIEAQYIGEDKPPGKSFFQGLIVDYLNATERQKYELFVVGGKLVDEVGNLFDTQKGSSVFQGGGGRAIFVMDPTGRIYANLNHSVGKFHHSSFLAGQPVAAAGEIEVDNGVVKLVTNRSGHYKPDGSYIAQFMQELKARGINIVSVVQKIM